MCGEYEGSTKGERIPPEFHIAQFATAVSRYVAKYRPSWLRIYQEGNYMNMHEMNNSTQIRILRLAGLLSGIRRITVESMAKYVSESSAESLRKAVPRDIELEIGMGFECRTMLSEMSASIGESLRDFQRAVSILRETGLRSVVNVILKPPFLSEGESNTEAIATIKKAEEIGFHAVSLEAMSIHKYSLVDALHAMGTYQVPWLWSVLEVA